MILWILLFSKYICLDFHVFNTSKLLIFAGVYKD